ncbi:MAG: hypothetical protein WBF34_23370, partial [Streptosporangiaceae bacterium]
MTARAVLPVAAVGGLAALSMAAPAATVAVSAASAATQVAAVRPVPDVGGPVRDAKQLPAPTPLTIAQCQAELKI